MYWIMALLWGLWVATWAYKKEQAQPQELTTFSLYGYLTTLGLIAGLFAPITMAYGLYSYMKGIEIYITE